MYDINGNMIYPAMTYYARVLDNVTNQEILSSADVTRNNTWYYGKCNGLEGGESQYIVEFDIWNNEKGINSGQTAIPFPNAINCSFQVWPDTNMQIDSSNKLFSLMDSNSNDLMFMQARCTTKDPYQPFVGIKYNTGLSDANLVGNVSGRAGVILGVGDHTTIQTKIMLPANSGLLNTRCNFVFAFKYDFE